MSNSRRTKHNAPAPAAAADRSRFPRSATVVLAVAVVAAAGLWWSKGRKAQTQPVAASPPAAVSPTNPPAPAPPATPSPAFEKLKGRWQRPDGGYIVEIRNVEPGGKLDASYFNPQSIHVAQAEATQEGAATKVFIELRDVNYPGSTYNLMYEAKRDQLLGVYYQAALQQQFEVVFERMR
jgi:hypothetical protein